MSETRAGERAGDSPARGWSQGTGDVTSERASGSGQSSDGRERGEVCVTAVQGASRELRLRHPAEPDFLLPLPGD